MSNGGSPSVEEVVDVLYNYIGYIENVCGLLESYKDDWLDEQKVDSLERELIDTTRFVILIKKCHNITTCLGSNQYKVPISEKHQYYQPVKSTITCFKEKLQLLKSTIIVGNNPREKSNIEVLDVQLNAIRVLGF
jgi:hypothetical protein